MEPVVSSLQPTTGSTQTGPAEFAERLNIRRILLRMHGVFR